MPRIPGAGIVDRWRAETGARGARRALMREMRKTSLPLTILVWLLVAVSAALRIGFIVATGRLLGALPAAARDGIHSPAGRRLVGGLILTGAIFVAQRLVVPLTQVPTEVLGRRLDAMLRTRLMAAALRPSGVAHLEDPEMLDRIRDAQGIGAHRGTTPWDALRGLTQNATARLASFGAAGILCGFRWWLGPIAVVFGILARYRLVGDMLSRAGTRLGQTKELRRSDYYRDLALSPQAAKETRIFGLGGWIGDRFAAHWQQGMQLIWANRKAGGTKSWTWSGAWAVLIFGGMLMLGRAAARGEITLQSLTILSQALLIACGIWLSITDTWVAQGAATLPALLEVERTAIATRDAPGTGDATGLPRSAVVFEDVRFHYPGRDEEVLRGLDLTVPAGRSLAIVGVNGAGKTTLIKLLCRLYDPTGGRIAVDGRDLRDLDADAWQRRVAAIFQDFVRSELPAADNVGFGAVQRREDRNALDLVARRIGAAPIVDGLPSGWETPLSRLYTGGTDLSGGQWQRIALARALFAVEGGAGVLVLDEPTANLDVRAEAELFDQFLELTRGATTILISHRFSSVRHAERICVLDEGRVAEQGTHDELMAAGGHYARLFMLQAARFRDEPEGEPADA